MEDFVWGKNADPTPAPPLQGRGVNSKGPQMCIEFHLTANKRVIRA